MCSAIFLSESGYFTVYFRPRQKNTENYVSGSLQSAHTRYAIQIMAIC